MSASPTWFVLGAGAIGTFLCHRLVEAGVSAVLLHHRAGSEERTLLLHGQPLRIPVRSIGQQTPGSVHRLMVTSKAGRIRDALHSAAPLLAKKAVLVTMANGMGFERELSAPPGGLILFRAVSTAAAYRNSRGEVVAAALGTTRVGALNSQAAEPAWFSDSLARLGGWSWESPIAPAVAEKFAVNCVVNPLTATLRCRNGELLDEEQAGPALRALCEETEPALRRLGLWKNPRSLVDVATEVCRVTRDNRSSMLQDVLAGRSTEIQYLNGELLRLAADMRLDLPINQDLFSALR